MKTRKVGASGRLGARYGKKVRANLMKVETLKSEERSCPRCTKKTVKRVAPGIWECKSCGHRFAGKAYKPS
jgi:large subunit ribosomal protein L37Ae